MGSIFCQFLSPGNVIFLGPRVGQKMVFSKIAQFLGQIISGWSRQEGVGATQLGAKKSDNSAKKIVPKFGANRLKGGLERYKKGWCQKDEELV